MDAPLLLSRAGAWKLGEFVATRAMLAAEAATAGRALAIAQKTRAGTAAKAAVRKLCSKTVQFTSRPDPWGLWVLRSGRRSGLLACHEQLLHASEAQHNRNSSRETVDRTHDGTLNRTHNKASGCRDIQPVPVIDTVTPTDPTHDRIPNTAPARLPAEQPSLVPDSYETWYCQAITDIDRAEQEGKQLIDASDWESFCGELSGTMLSAYRGSLAVSLVVLLLVLQGTVLPRSCMQVTLASAFNPENQELHSRFWLGMHDPNWAKVERTLRDMAEGGQDSNSTWGYTDTGMMYKALRYCNADFSLWSIGIPSLQPFRGAASGYVLR